MPIKTKNILNISAGELDRAYRALETDIGVEIERMRVLGISDDEIYSRLEASLTNNLGSFGKFKGAIEKEFDIILGETAQVESNQVFEGTKEELKWELDPTAQEHCPDCLDNSEEVKTFDEWSMIGLPGMGNTQCGTYCRCTLTVSG